MGEQRIVKIIEADAAVLDAHRDQLAEMMAACVREGASIGFVQPFAVDDAAHFWRTRVRPAVDGGGARLFLGLSDTRTVVGTVQLVLPTMPNQTHKAEIAKMMVHPSHRRQGIARALMTTVMDAARGQGFRVLTLDTRSGDPAQALYASFGFKVAGEIPDFAIDPDDPAKLDPTTYMYARL